MYMFLSPFMQRFGYFLFVSLCVCVCVSTVKCLYCCVLTLKDTIATNNASMDVCRGLCLHLVSEHMRIALLVARHHL